MQQIIIDIYTRCVTKCLLYIHISLVRSSIFNLREGTKKSLTGSGWIRYTVWLSYSRQKNRQFYFLYILINFLLLLLKITIFKGVYFTFLCCWFFFCCHWVNYLKCHCYYNISQYLFLIDIYISMLIFFLLFLSSGFQREIQYRKIVDPIDELGNQRAFFAVSAWLTTSYIIQQTREPIYHWMLFYY